MRTSEIILKALAVITTVSRIQRREVGRSGSQQRAVTRQPDDVTSDKNMVEDRNRRPTRWPAYQGYQGYQAYHGIGHPGSSFRGGLHVCRMNQNGQPMAGSGNLPSGDPLPDFALAHRPPSLPLG